ncbi:MAG: SGNH/GDSL hydrolase family protein [Promethearchaeota archaeon]
MKDNYIFVCLGDSLTAGSPGFSGYGTWHGNEKSQYEYWAEKLAKEAYPNIEIEFANFGVGGNTIWQMQYRFKHDVLRLMTEDSKPDYVILFGGINDILGTGASARDVAQDLEELYNLIMANDIGVIPMEITPCTVTKRYISIIKESNDYIHDLAQRHNLKAVIPTYSALMDETGDYLNSQYDYGDGVHFNVAGYKKIGETVFQTLNDAIFKS